MTFSFQQPSAGGKFTPADHNGRLLLIHAQKLEEGIVTNFGTSDAIRCNIVVLDAPDGPEQIDDALLFSKALVGSLRNAVGEQPVLGRLGQGQAKPGQSAPWVLNPYTDADAVTAQNYLAAQPKPFAQAQGTATAPAPAATPAAAPAAPLDPNSPEVQALLAQIQSQQAPATPAA